MVTPSLEMIDFQPVGKYVELEQELERLCRLSSLKAHHFSAFEELVLKHFGVQVKIKPLSYANAYMQILVMSDRSPILTQREIDLVAIPLQEGTLNFMEQVNRSYTVPIKDPNAGTVDWKNAKLGGAFSTIVFTTGLGIQPFKEAGLNAKEILAIFFHELGHAFTSIAYTVHAHRFNKVLEDLRRRKLPSYEEKMDYFVDLSLRAKLFSKEELDQIKNSGSHIALTTSITALYFKQTWQDSATGAYNDTSGEQLADAFSTRLGYGEYLISGFVKTGMPSSTLLSNTLFGLIGAVLNTVILSTAVSLIFLPAVSMAILAFISGFISGLTMAFLFMIVFGGYLNTDRTYDTAQRRFFRMRNELIAFVKQNRGAMSRGEIASYSEKIKTLDALIKPMGDEYMSLFDYMHDWLSKPGKLAKRSVKFEQFLEDLAHHRLHLTREEIRTTYV